MKDVQDKLVAAGFSIENQSPDNFVKTVNADIAYWKQVLIATGTKPQCSSSSSL